MESKDKKTQAKANPNKTTIRKPKHFNYRRGLIPLLLYSIKTTQHNSKQIKANQDNTRQTHLIKIIKMTPAELMILKQLRSEGYSVVHQGCPDFLCFKLKQNNEIQSKAIQNNTTQFKAKQTKNNPSLEDIDLSSVRFVEVKYRGDILKHEQIIWKYLLEKLGLPYKLIHISPEILSAGVS